MMILLDIQSELQTSIVTRPQELAHKLLAIHYHAAIAVNSLTADTRAITRRQEYDTSRDLRRLGWPAHRTREFLLRLLIHRRRDERCPHYQLVSLRIRRARN